MKKDEKGSRGGSEKRGLDKKFRQMGLCCQTRIPGYITVDIVSCCVDMEEAAACAVSDDWLIAEVLYFTHLSRSFTHLSHSVCIISLEMHCSFLCELVSCLQCYLRMCTYVSLFYSCFVQKLFMLRDNNLMLFKLVVAVVNCKNEFCVNLSQLSTSYPLASFISSNPHAREFEFSYIEF